MKNLSPAISSLIAEKLGNEPVSIVEVQWVVDGNWYVYGDKNITNYEFNVDGVIQELSTLESVIKLDSQGQTNGINIRLSDHKGDLKTIIDNNDIHGRLVRVYQWLEGIPLSERFLLYEGEITSSITWNEGDRTLSFLAITQLADKEVGFSPEEGNFPFLIDSLVGQTWPLIFGKVQNVPTVRLFDVPSTQSSEELSAVDPSIAEQLSKLGGQRTNLIETHYVYTFALLQAEFTCEYGETPEQRSHGCSMASQISSILSQLTNQISQLDQERSNLNAQRLDQLAELNDTITVVNGENFPQGEIIIIQIGNINLSGTFSGNIFTITNREILDYAYEDGDDPFGFTFIQAGSAISIKTDSPLIYIVSIIPCTVHTVQAYRRLENEDVLTIVPSDWYTIKTTNIGSYTITYIETSLPISSRDSTMQDDLYVTCTSTVGPNTVDIIEWLINTYTNLSYDATTFAAVKIKLENYPSHFALLDRKNIFDLLEDIAFQSRCAIWISQRTFYLKYLSEEQTEQDTVTESDIDAGSLELFTTNTEDLVTKLTATWRDNYASSETNKLILRHNIKKYGTRERDIDFYIYNLPELVLKSATFWLIRFSNVWKNIRFKTYLHKMHLETFDIVKFNFAQNFIANAAVKGMLTKVTYDSDSQTINIESWLPVKFGTMIPYIFTWPSEIDIGDLFPTTEEIAQGYAGGDGPGADTEGGFALTDDEKTTIGYNSSSYYSSNRIRDQRLDYGDEKPTDVGDVKPVPKFTGTEFSLRDSPSYDYTYGDYQVGAEQDVSATSEYSSCFPGRVEGKIESEGDTYQVTIFKNGITVPGTLVTVKQLQIDLGAYIPIGTWVMVAVNKLEDETEEYTMQVAVWL